MAGIAAYFLLKGAAQEFIYGLAEGFAHDVPKRDIDCGNGVEVGAAPPWPLGHTVERFPNGVDFKGVAADQQLADIAGKCKERWRVDNRANHSRRRTSIAETNDAFVSKYSDDDGFQAGVTTNFELWVMKDIDFQVSYFHRFSRGMCCF